MSPHADRLCGILERHRALADELLELGDAKREAILANRCDDLNTIVLGEMKHITAIRKLEEDRLLTVEALGSSIGTRPNARMDDIISQLGEDAAAMLAQARDTLKAVLRRLQEQTARNQALLEASLEHVDGFFSAIRNLKADRPTYNYRGVSSQKGQPFVNRTA